MQERAAPPTTRYWRVTIRHLDGRVAHQYVERQVAGETTVVATWSATQTDLTGQSMTETTGAFSAAEIRRMRTTVPEVRAQLRGVRP